ncbi:MAG: MBL fold metallo-hydrolase [Clostridiales bacterium]|nr:MBL fold metallo-hydrolase [Clostridiales bacterium]
MEITYLGHSCFKFVKDGFALIMDPYNPGSVPGLEPLKETANQVVCSHKHGDHYGLKSVKLASVRADTPFLVDLIETFHDDKEGALRGKNFITIVNIGGHKVVHMGDIGCMISDDDIELLKGCDILLIPVGGFYTIDAKTAKKYVDKISPAVTIPMHYSGDGFGYSEIAPVDGFVRLFPKKDVAFEGSEISVEDTSDLKKIIVMKPLKAVKG